MTQARICPTCNAENPPDNDFCMARTAAGGRCGTYLAWDDSTERPVATLEPDDASSAPTVALDPRPQAGELRVLVDGIDLTLPESAHGLRVVPGKAVVLDARVRNEGETVDTFTVAVEGFPPDWIQSSRRALDLLPPGPHGGFDGTITLTINVPRSSLARAGTWPFAVVLRSQSRRGQDARVEGTVEVEPFVELATEVRPQVATGRRRARFVCTVVNRGNASVGFGVVTHDAEEACVFKDVGTPSAPAGESTDVPLRVRPAKPIWVGRPKDHRVTVKVTAPELAGPVAVPPVVFRQRPWIPWWVPPFIALLAAAAAALYALWPRTVTMPALVGERSALAAQQDLERAGVRTRPKIELKVERKLAPGTVVAQTPPAGRKVEPTVAVTLVVAGGPGKTIVPRVVGLRTAQADHVLSRVRLKLGAITPGLDPKAPIKSQVPAAGSTRRQGTAVAVVLAKRTVPVPDVRGLTPSKAEKKLHQAGLSLGHVQPKLRSKGKITSQVPAPHSRRPVGTGVDVVLAKRMVMVPNLTGADVQFADTALRVCGLKLGRLPPGIEPGQRIVSQVPAASTALPKGSRVAVIMGPAPEEGAKHPALPQPSECAVP